MKKNIVISIFLLPIVLLAADYSIFGLDGKKIGNEDCLEKTECVSSARSKYSKAIVIVGDSQKSFSSKTLSRSTQNDDSFKISLRDSISWVEVEKNTMVSLCVDDANGGRWFIYDLSYSSPNDSCVLFDSGKFVKSSQIRYVSKTGKKQIVNILVGMRRIDLSKSMHEIGFYGKEYSLKKNVIYTDERKNMNNREYPDPVRDTSIKEILAVDKYLVTNCEIIYGLWDSIPSYSRAKDKIPLEYHNYWIGKKKNMQKNGICDTHDSAAVRVYLYDALVYANARSIRDGLKPVYKLKKIKQKKYLPKLYKDGSFDVATTSFFETYENSDEGWIRVEIDNNADGYRLPYYNEWMTLAKAGNKKSKYIWGNSENSTLASEYAWFGEGVMISEKYGVYDQESRPVGMKKPNDYGLYDMMGLVCENVMLPGKSIFGNEITSCKGGFLYDSLQALNFGAHANNYVGGYGKYQGLRLVRLLK